jgi:hypothetical protein
MNLIRSRGVYEVTAKFSTYLYRIALTMPLRVAALPWSALMLSLLLARACHCYSACQTEHPTRSI